MSIQTWPVQGRLSAPLKEEIGPVPQELSLPPRQNGALKGAGSSDLATAGSSRRARIGCRTDAADYSKSVSRQFGMLG